jgi:predicted nucleic acid-binding protein
VIFDNNILIYISKNILTVADVLPVDVEPKISVVSYIEALGYAFATEKDKFYMEQICSLCQRLELTEDIVQQTVRLKSKYKIKLPDAIIYATASVQNTPLLTNNVADFTALDGNVQLINPFTL